MTTTEKPRTLSPRLLFRSFAVAEMFTWAGLITALVLREFDVANLVPITAAAAGEISISSTPSGANVFVDNEYKGITPVTIPGVASGTRDVLLRLTGYQDNEDQVNVPAGGTATVSVAMKPEGEAKATPGFGITAAFAALGISGLVVARRRGRI